jgi:nicotinamidase-related amidase
MRLSPRYYRWHVDPGVTWVETNTEYAQLDWTVPVAQAALVLVDVWDGHYLIDTEDRINQIVHDQLVPLVTAARSAGLPVIHAPAPEVARGQPGWVKRLDKAPLRGDPAWPPPAFRKKEGTFAAYGRPKEPREPELDVLRRERRLHPDIQPLPGERVVAYGEELHLCCKEAGILFLFYAGFNTNACIVLRDYGTVAMANRGYEVILVRDCTTGMESYETHDAQLQTKGTVLFLEMFRGYSVTSDQIIAGLHGVKA